MRTNLQVVQVFAAHALFPWSLWAAPTDFHRGGRCEDSAVSMHQKSFLMRVDGTPGHLVLEKSPAQSSRQPSYLFCALPHLHPSILQDLCHAPSLVWSSQGLRLCWACVLGWAHQWCWWWLCHPGLLLCPLAEPCANWLCHCPLPGSWAHGASGVLWARQNINGEHWYFRGGNPFGTGTSQESLDEVQHLITIALPQKFLFSPKSHKAKPVVKSWDCWFFFPLSLFPLH